MRKKRKDEKRLTAVSQLVIKAKKDNIFDLIWPDSSAKGQHGIFVYVQKKSYSALVRVESKKLPLGAGYGATETEGSRIGYLSVSKEGRSLCNYGIWDPEEQIRSPRHDFNKDPEGVRNFVGLIMKYFSR